MSARAARALQISKAANIFMANELHRRKDAYGVEAASCHPGLCNTQLQKRTWEEGAMTKFLGDTVLHKMNAHSMLDGAVLILTAAFFAQSGEFVCPKGCATRGPISIEKANAYTYDEEAGKLLWEASEVAVGEKF